MAAIIFWLLNLDLTAVLGHHGVMRRLGLTLIAMALLIAADPAWAREEEPPGSCLSPSVRVSVARKIENVFSVSLAKKWGSHKFKHDFKFRSFKYKKKREFEADCYIGYEATIYVLQKIWVSSDISDKCVFEDVHQFERALADAHDKAFRERAEELADAYKAFYLSKIKFNKSPSRNAEQRRDDAKETIRKIRSDMVAKANKSVKAMLRRQPGYESGKERTFANGTAKPGGRGAGFFEKCGKKGVYKRKRKLKADYDERDVWDSEWR